MLRLTIDQMLDLAWTWEGPNRIDDQGEVFFQLRIAELPDFFLAAESYEAVVSEIKPALKAFLSSYIDRGETPPLPELDKWLFTVGSRAREVARTGPRPKELVAA